MNYLIGVDIGTQGTKAVMINAQGKIIATSYKGYDIIQPQPLWAEQWPDVWLDAVYNTIKTVIEKGKINAKMIIG